MPLTCACDSGDDCRWYYDPPDDYWVFKGPRRKRCSSCQELIAVGTTVAVFGRWRPPADDVECRIYGEDGEIKLAPMYLCERCADLYFSFCDLGYGCVSPDENMLELAKEYAEARVT